MKNTGKPYEIITRQIFDSILNHSRDDINTIEVQHDVTLTGRSTTHQIDVYWEFIVGGIKYITIVQAKDWSTNAVDQGELLKFKCVLDDLPNQPRGIFVTRTGYQQGAFNYARHHGILLYELREPTDADKLGRVMRITLDIDSYLSHSSGIRITHDERWMYEEAVRLQLAEIPKIRMGESRKTLCYMIRMVRRYARSRV